MVVNFKVQIYWSWFQFCYIMPSHVVETLLLVCEENLDPKENQSY